MSSLEFSCNLSFLFQEYEFKDRFVHARNWGFNFVEITFPYLYDKNEIKKYLDENNLKLHLINSPPGNAKAGDRGLAALPNRKEEFKKSFEEAMQYAQAFNCPFIHIMSGVRANNENSGLFRDTLIENLQWAADQIASEKTLLLIEPINQIDIPSYFLFSWREAEKIVREINNPKVRLQLDLYHAQVETKNIEAAWAACKDITKHIQIANVPKRTEPTLGDIDYSKIFDLIEQDSYDGLIGLEFRPSQTTEIALREFKKLRNSFSRR
jgi:hydroxypyruvate isomerase